MRAALLHTIPGELVIEDVAVDRPGPHEVLIRNAAAGVCHSDLHFMEGTYFWETPVVLGHESAGIVEAVGDEVTYVSPGDHVITCTSVFCGECEQCLTGHPYFCANPSVRRPTDGPSRLTLDGAHVAQFAELGSFAEQLLVHERAVVKVDESIPLDRAALLGCGVITGVGAVLHTAKVEPGSTVAVIGCGGIGLNCIQAAALAGALRVIAVDRVPSKLELAKTFGATDVVQAGGDTDPVVAVRELTGGGVDYSFEAIGLKVTVEQAFAMLRNRGTATVIGMVPIGQTIELQGVDFLGEKRIQGSVMGSNRFRVDMPQLLDFYRQGRLKLDELVSAKVPLDRVNEAYAELKTGEVARTVITFD
jgi:S-(hydroxymethyl)glutathione dehydrogenase/alcohol dehydrogenase